MATTTPLTFTAEGEIAPPSAPFLNMPTGADPEHPVLDDIPDPTVPSEAIPPEVVRAAEDWSELVRDIHGVMNAVDKNCNTLLPFLQKEMVILGDRLEHYFKTLSPESAGALQHLCEAVDKATHGMTVQGAPYKATVATMSPAGYPMELTIERRDGAEFIDALAKVEAWLQQAGYRPAERIY